MDAAAVPVSPTDTAQETPLYLALAPASRRQFVDRVAARHPERQVHLARIAHWEVLEVPLGRIASPRRPVDRAGLAALVAALRRGTCLPPLLVEVRPDGRLRLLDGLARLRALRRRRVATYCCLVGQSAA